MTKPRVGVLRAAGTNCDIETMHAWEIAGALTDRVHVRELMANPGHLRDYQIITVPGGFSYGDDLGAGRILATQISRALGFEFREFVDRGGFLLGICNGFQVLVKAGLLGTPRNSTEATCTIAHSVPAGYHDRWICVQSRAADCVFLEPNHTYELPMAHGEGRVVFRASDAEQAALQARLNALVYIPPPPDSPAANGPFNPNGSTADIAGLCDETGRVLGLMPHPERFVSWQQYPSWTTQPTATRADGLLFFQAAVKRLTR